MIVVPVVVVVPKCDKHCKRGGGDAGLSSAHSFDMNSFFYAIAILIHLLMPANTHIHREPLHSYTRAVFSAFLSPSSHLGIAHEQHYYHHQQHLSR
jgi:hypothetical protein